MIIKRPYSISFIFILPILLSAKITLGQIHDLSDIKTKFIQFRKNDLQEKLFIQTNKNFYVAGEILWFKIYDINGATNSPFDFSKVAYVELLDKNNNPVLQTKVSLKGDGGGSIELPFTLHSGNYLFRAYTSWMKNFSPAYYFHKPITIVNTTRGNDFPKSDGSINYDIQFFPEGGNLVNGLQSIVAFKMADQYGNAVSFKGAITDRNNDTILHFKPFKFGMGHFSFTPESGNLYHAVIQTKDHQIITKDLPVAYHKGYVMHVETLNNNQVKITVHTNIPSQKKAYLFIHTRESVKTAEVLSIAAGNAVFKINQRQLGEGISQITLFNSNRQPVCERLYFKPVKKKLTVKASTDKGKYSTRQKVNLHLSTYNELGKAVQANLSVSVYKLDQLQTISGGNILNYLWLRSELRGRILHPAYYFKNQNDNTRRALDNLMMTQGWRRFDWEKVLKQSPVLFQYAPELSGPVISGMVINRKTNMADPNTLAYLALPGKHVHLHVSRSNETGKVFFNMKHFYGHHQIVVRTNTQTKDSLDQINILSPFSEKYADESLPKFSIASDLASPLDKHNLWMQVAHAYHENKRNQRFPITIDTTAFYGKPYKTYLLDNYTRYVTMEEVLREYVMEVVLRKKKQQYHFKVMNALFAFDQNMPAMLFQDDPLVLFDGVPVFDINKVVAFDPLKVQKIEVVAGRYFYKSLAADGIVSFITYKGDMRNYPLNPHAVVLDYNGLQLERKFYSPIYANEKQQPSHIPDFRNALYWNPSLESDNKGMASCTFYSSDIPGQYVVVVNGITPNGRAGSGASFFKVIAP